VLKHIELPKVGRIVEVVKGRDKGLHAVVVGHVPDRYVLLADGHVRKVTKPKKKNVLHVRFTPHHVTTRQTSAADSEGKFTNAQLRYALRELRETQATSRSEEGDGPNGER
jgi:large subunit ribosomal protein L14e